MVAVFRRHQAKLKAIIGGMAAKLDSHVFEAAITTSEGLLGDLFAERSGDEQAWEDLRILHGDLSLFYEEAYDAVGRRAARETAKVEAAAAEASVATAVALVATARADQVKRDQRAARQKRYRAKETVDGKVKENELRCKRRLKEKATRDAIKENAKKEAQLVPRLAPLVALAPNITAVGCKFARRAFDPKPHSSFLSPASRAYTPRAREVVNAAALLAAIEW